MNGSRPLWPGIVFVVLALLLVAGLVQLFQARFATGDVYPKYSTLRSDPLGARVLFEALDQAGIRTERNHRDLARASPGTATIYLSGMEWRDFEKTSVDDVAALLDSVRAGSRLVIGFSPQDPERNKAASVFETRGESRNEKLPGAKLTRDLGVDARWLPAGQEELLQASPVAGGPLTGGFPWHTALAFEGQGGLWRRIHEVNRFAAVLERSYGAGTIVLVGDAYLLSNEAMVRDRQSALLAWLQGPHARAVFDETHLGVVENTGIAALARRYGLAHTALALLVVAGLHLWRSGSALVPPARDRPADTEELAGRDASSGLVNLLQRTLPPKDLFSACLHEYKHGASWRRLPPEVQRSLDAIGLTSGARGRGPLESLRAAHELLKRKT